MPTEDMPDQSLKVVSLRMSGRFCVFLMRQGMEEFVLETL